MGRNLLEGSKTDSENSYNNNVLYYLFDHKQRQLSENNVNLGCLVPSIV